MSGKLDKTQIRNLVQRIKAHLQIKSAVKKDLQKSPSGEKVPIKSRQKPQD